MLAVCVVARSFAVELFFFEFPCERLTASSSRKSNRVEGKRKDGRVKVLSDGSRLHSVRFIPSAFVIN